MKKRLGRLESMALAYAQMRAMRIVRTGDLTAPLRLSAGQEQGLLRRLARGGIIARIRPGAYVIPGQMPYSGEWAPDEAQALDALMQDAGARYQVCGLNAFNRYHFDEQVPNRIYTYNNRISGERAIGAIRMTLIKVADGRLGDTDVQQRPDGEKMVFSSRARSLVDAVYDWALFNSIPAGYQWIQRELAEKRVRPADFVRCTLAYGDSGTIRRIGCLLEKLKISPPLLRELEQAIALTRAYIPWIPRHPKRGRVNKRWGVVENDKPGDLDEISA
jgi:predicted transcriptional regulator of viral defense system